MKNVVCIALSLTLIVVAACYAEKSPPPQYINIAPLPGDGFALNSQGKADPMGAMQINIPVAYTPGAEFFNLGAYGGQFEDGQSSPAWNNGTGSLGMGFGKKFRWYSSIMAVSTGVFNDSKCLSGQAQLVEEKRNTPAIAIGAQDILDKETKDFGADYSTGVSWYLVATKSFQVGDRPVYGTLGYGKARFLNHPFAGISFPVNKHFTFTTEYDGFQFNAGIGWRPGKSLGDTTILAAYNENAGPLIGVQGTGKVSSWIAVPLILMFRRT